MTPTQAQIEAAAKIMFEAEQLARSEPRTESDCRVLARLALTAAAEAGEQIEYNINQWQQINRWLNEREGTTIERCAQVAEAQAKRWKPPVNTVCQSIAAAIRAMKD